MRSWASLSLAAVALLGCGERVSPAPPPAATAVAEDCVGAAAPANGCPETDAVAPGGERGTPCEPAQPLGLVEPCAFGPADGEPFALVGDSHANALRSAFTVAAEKLGRRGYAITRNGCPYVREGRPLPEPAFTRCATWKAQVPEWLAAHPEVRTVYVIGLPRNAATQDPANWLAAWDRLPAGVRLVVIRDTPELGADTLACVRSATRRPGSSCAVPRTTALAPDPAVEAAARRGAPTIDLTRFFCDAERCRPVIGGILAYLDATHLTPAFSVTLGPFLAGDLERVG